jgi:hypothetical protein
MSFERVGNNRLRCTVCGLLSAPIVHEANLIRLRNGTLTMFHKCEPSERLKSVEEQIAEERQRNRSRQMCRGGCCGNRPRQPRKTEKC